MSKKAVSIDYFFSFSEISIFLSSSSSFLFVLFFVFICYAMYSKLFPLVSKMNANLSISYLLSIIWHAMDSNTRSLVFFPPFPFCSNSCVFISLLSFFFSSSSSRKSIVQRVKRRKKTEKVNVKENESSS